MSRPAPTPQQVERLFEELKTFYRTRNSEFLFLRRAFNGQYPDTLVQQDESTYGDNKDPFANSQRLRYNMINTAIRRYQDEMSAGVRIKGLPAGLEPEDISLAEKRTKWLRQVYDENKLALLIPMAAFDQSLLDKAIWQVRIDPRRKCRVRVSLVIPECYFPVPAASDWSEKDAVIIAYQKFNVGNFDYDADPDGTKDKTMPTVAPWCIEWWDAEWYCKVETHPTRYTVAPIRHALDIIPIAEAHNIPIPGQQRGQGDADQAVGLNIYLNQIMSDVADTISYLANPIVIVRGRKTGTGDLAFGPRAIWELERDGDAQILQWAGAPPTFEAQFMRTMQGIEDALGQGGPVFGRDLPAGVSGNAIRAITAGFGGRVGSKQTYMSLALKDIFEWAQMLIEREYPNEKFAVVGEGASSESPVVFQPKEMKGWYNVKVAFEPQDQTTKVFAELQKAQARVQSKLRTIENLGIEDPADELQRITMESSNDAQAQQGMAPGLPPPERKMSPKERAIEEQKKKEIMRMLASGAGNPLAGGGEGLPRDANEGAGAQAFGQPQTNNPGESMLPAIMAAAPRGRVWVPPFKGPEGGPVNIMVSDEGDVERLRSALEPRYGTIFTFTKTANPPEGYMQAGR